MDTPASDAQAVEKHIIPFEFTGNSSEFFSIWVVNVLLTILTFGMYSPWAKVRTYQYFYGNTRLDGASFRYLASPVQILKGRLIALVFFAAWYFSGLISPAAAGVMIVIIALLVPAMVVMSMSFQLRNTSHRNIKFNFQKDFKRAYTLFAFPLLFIVLYFLLITYFQSDAQANAVTTENETETLPTVFLFAALPLFIICLFPLWQYMMIKFKSTHAHFGQTHFSFDGTAGKFYRIYISAFLVIVLFGLLSAVVLGELKDVLAANEERSFLSTLLIVPLLGFFLLLPLYLWLLSYIRTKVINFTFGNLSIAEHRVQSELKVGTMLYLYVTNTLAIVISLGLLIPWAKVRTARYRVQMTSIIVAGSLDNFFGVQPNGQSAFGEEMGEVFDMGLGI